MSKAFIKNYEKINISYLSHNNYQKTKLEIEDLDIGKRSKSWLSRFFELRDQGIIVLPDPEKNLSKSNIRDIITTNIEYIKRADNDTENNNYK